MSYKRYWRCKRCNYTENPEVMTQEAKLLWNELSEEVKQYITDLFELLNKEVYENKLTGLEKSKFLYTVGGTDMRYVVQGIKQYLTEKMHKKAMPLSYLSRIILNTKERESVQLKAERRLRGYDPPE